MAPRDKCGHQHLEHARLARHDGCLGLGRGVAELERTEALARRRLRLTRQRARVVGDHQREVRVGGEQFVARGQRQHPPRVGERMDHHGGVGRGSEFGVQGRCSVIAMKKLPWLGIVAERLDHDLMVLALRLMDLAELLPVALRPVAPCTTPPGAGRDAEVRLEGALEHLGRAEADVQRDGQGGLRRRSEQAAGRHFQPAAAHALGQRLAGQGLE